MPEDQDIEEGHSESQSSFEIGPFPVCHLLEMRDSGEHGKDCLDQHPIVPCATGTDLHVGGISIAGGLETGQNGRWESIPLPLLAKIQRLRLYDFSGQGRRIMKG